MLRFLRTCWVSTGSRPSEITRGALGECPSSCWFLGWSSPHEQPRPVHSGAGVMEQAAGTWADFLGRDTKAWGLTPRHALMIAAVPILVSLAISATVLYPRLFHKVIEEDRLVEWLQF